MVGQLRIYTINKGMAESWLKLFHEVIAPKTLEFGMGIQSAWMDEEKERFIWIRTYESLEDIKVKEDAFTEVIGGKKICLLFEATLQEER